MAGSSGEVIIVPRNFQLLDELEKTEKGQTDMSISMGLSDGSDVFMREWVCTILGPNGGPLENRIISVHLTCGDDYPKVPPSAHFLTKVNAPDFVAGDGQVTADKLKKILDAAGGWAGDRRTMQTVLLALRNQLRSKTMPKQQPPDGTCY